MSEGQRENSVKEAGGVKAETDKKDLNQLKPVEQHQTRGCT